MNSNPFGNVTIEWLLEGLEDCKKSENEKKTDDPNDFVTTEIEDGTFIGHMKFGLPHGQGELKCKTGEIFIGSFVLGKREGYGVENSGGDVYEGEFSSDKRHGQGHLKFASGEEYDGEWILDLIHGAGDYKYMNGSLYFGDFQDGKRHGYGLYFDAKYGIRYRGSFVNNVYHGKGDIFFEDGDVYSGEFRNGHMHGNGAMSYADGSHYEGQWLTSYRNGLGTFTDVDGTVETLVWNEGDEDFHVIDGDDEVDDAEEKDKLLLIHQGKVSGVKRKADNHSEDDSSRDASHCVSMLAGKVTVRG
jgi:hypothetical protein